uniref:Uncharacterized protein n=1 Tax=Oryza punctata TaxID=4537 RepID=A0A0E0LJ58_ORYPU
MNPAIDGLDLDGPAQAQCHCELRNKFKLAYITLN